MVVLGVSLAASPVALAQNKCVDAKGKVFYQQDPCPGSQRLTLPKPPAPPAGQPAPRTEEAQWRELAELQRCKGDWETVAAEMKRSREDAATLSGEELAREKDVLRVYLEESMQRFLPVCRRHGFDYPRDAQVEQRNAAVAVELGKRSEAMRAELETAKRLEAKQRAAAEQAGPTPEEIAAHEKQCSGYMRDIGTARATLRNITEADRRAAREREIAAIEANYNRSCRGS